MGERMCRGAVRVIEKHHGGTGPCVHPELLGTESNGQEEMVREKQNQGSRNLQMLFAQGHTKLSESLNQGILEENLVLLEDNEI